LLALPPMGVVGCHPAALSANRGRHPRIWALALSLKLTVPTFFIMEEGADSGDIVSPAGVDIAADDDAGSLYLKIVATVCGQFDTPVPGFTNNRLYVVSKTIAGTPTAGSDRRQIVRSTGVCSPAVFAT
jgi:methionyl-tRNA formyltransferase